MVTDYSGSGGAEQAVVDVNDAVPVVMPHLTDAKGTKTFFKAYRANDKDPLCRRVLCNMDKRGAPEVVQSDITERLTTEELAAMEAICTRWCTFYDDSKGTANNTSKAAKQTCGRGVFDELLDFATGIDFGNRTSTCQKNQYRECNVFASVESSEDIPISIYGHSCGAWSVFGKRDGWLYRDAINLACVVASNVQH